MLISYDNNFFLMPYRTSMSNYEPTVSEGNTLTHARFMCFFRTDLLKQQRRLPQQT